MSGLGAARSAYLPPRRWQGQHGSVQQGPRLRALRSAPGLKQLIWRRLPAILLWGTLLPLGLAGFNRALAPAVSESGAGAGALLLWDYTMFGVVVLLWTLVLTLALGCFIVRVMKGPAYVADAYPLPDRSDDITHDQRASD